MYKSIKEMDIFISDGNYSSKYPRSDEFVDEGIPFIRGNNMIDGEIVDGDMYHITKEKHNILLKGHVKPGDVLITTRGNIGQVAIVPERHNDSNINAQIVLLRVNREELYNRYLLWALQSQKAKEQYLSLQTGTALKQLPVGKLEQVKIKCVDLKSQFEIAEIFDKAYKLINIRKKELEVLDELIKARFVELFGDPMTNSNGYVLKTYGELFELNAGGTPSKQKSEYWDNGTISWIGSNMCQNAVIYENDGNYITVEGLNHSSARMFPIDTVLIALVGATIGKTALLKFETTTNQNVLGVRGIRESGYTPEFIFYYTQGLYQKFLNIGDGGFAMASKGFISELPVPIVELELQEQFTAFAHQVDKSKVAVQKSLDEAQLLFDCLMQKYFG